MSAAEAVLLLAATPVHAPKRINAQADALGSLLPIGRGKDMRWRERGILARSLRAVGLGWRGNREPSWLFPLSHKKRGCSRVPEIHRDKPKQIRGLHRGWKDQSHAGEVTCFRRRFA